MSVFAYTALRHNGEKVSGELEAQNRAEAYHQLDRNQLQPISLGLKNEPEPSPPREAAPFRSSGHLHLTRSQIILFTEELSDLLEAGLRLEPALRIMEQRQELSSLKLVVEALRQDVVRGTRFSSALESVSPSFGELYCHLVAAGELSGALPNILRRQAVFLATMEELQSRVLQALIYPAFIMGSGILLLGIFMTVLVPQLTVLFTRTGKTLPLPTRVLIAASDFTVHYWWAMLGGAILAGVVFWRLLQHPEGRRWWDRTKLTIPLSGIILTARFYAQFAQTLATLVTSGIPLLNGLRLMQAATPNVYLKALLDQVVERVADGGSFSRALKQAGQFPPAFMDVVTVGEQTGHLGAALEKLARRYDRDLSRRIERLTTMIQPAVIVVMAICVGLVAYAIMVGIFQAISGFRMHG